MNYLKYKLGTIVDMLGAKKGRSYNLDILEPSPTGHSSF